MSNGDFSNVYKIVVIGDAGVGKTSILNRFTDGTFDDNCGPTALGGKDFKSKTINIDGKTVKLSIWDTAGQDTASLLTRSYYKGAAGALIVFDVGVTNSFNNLANWIEDLDRYSSTVVAKIIVGNKNDRSDRLLETDSARSWSDRNELVYMESSAKNGHNIENLFTALGRQMLTKHKPIVNNKQEAIVQVNTLEMSEEPKKKRSCQML